MSMSRKSGRQSQLSHERGCRKRTFFWMVAAGALHGMTQKLNKGFTEKSTNHLKPQIIFCHHLVLWQLTWVLLSFPVFASNLTAEKWISSAGKLDVISFSDRSWYYTALMWAVVDVLLADASTGDCMLGGKSRHKRKVCKVDWSTWAHFSVSNRETVQESVAAYLVSSTAFKNNSFGILGGTASEFDTMGLMEQSCLYNNMLSTCYFLICWSLSCSYHSQVPLY